MVSLAHPAPIINTQFGKLCVKHVSNVFSNARNYALDGGNYISHVVSSCDNSFGLFSEYRTLQSHIANCIESN